MEELFNAQRQGLFAYLYRLSGDVQLAEDLLQETFERCLRHYAPKDVRPALLYKIARNALIDARRRRCLHLVGEREGFEPAPQERALAAKQAVAGLEAALARLEALDREALAFAAAGELSYAEIAGLLGLSEASLKVRIHRARLKLRELMKENGHAG
ncbi:MAG: RNA polymerase sigma factor SigM [Deltaproteobacteria bacterium ADurb.Bin510]|nr:MAG: RNA polymerase sigma factor SigM [Deltaproteobacteria bacterium ADurb.Bin510]